ncbi:MAG: EAL domain-containing protein [Alphaproteobacteria bacterium]|nr:EAL domain-containing protein [Alphaproteobacteria bacterium]
MIDQSLVRQIGFIGGSLLLAVAAGFILPKVVSSMGVASTLAASLALVALIGLGILATIQRGDAQAQAAEIESLRNALRLIERVLSEGHSEVATRRNSTQETPMREDHRVERVVAEVRILQNLIERLNQAGHPQPAAPEALAPAADAPSPEQVAVPDVQAAPVPIVTPGATELIAETLREALRLDRVDVFLQPVVALPQRKPRFYECFSRVRAADGTLVLPEQYLPVAERDGLTGTIDNIQLFRCVQLIRRARRKSIDTAFFCNLSHLSLADPEFFPAFVELLAENADLVSGLMFEFPQAEAEKIFRDQRAELARLTKLGYRFSLDRVTDLRLDAHALAARNVRFIKVEVTLLLADGRTPADNRALKEKLDAAGIGLIAEKVEREKDLLELLDAGIDFGQGYLFGQPRPARAA